MSDEWEPPLAMPGMPPPVPDAPHPLSPTFTSSSSQTLNSSQTSYSSDQYFAPRLPEHWARTVFDGSNPGTGFRDGFQLDDPTVCYGNVDNASIQHLARDGFLPAVEHPFIQGQAEVQLHFRPEDSRARILFIAKDGYGRERLSCGTLTNLKVIRNLSSLQLCRTTRDGRYSLWAQLDFYLYERMVLFYSTFVAMKRQDRTPIPHEDLLDGLELSRGPDGEKLEFAGQIRDGDLLHALRLYRDRGSGVYRIEATALRGPMKYVPLWTAFVTRYAHDPDWAHHDGGGVVSLIAVRPKPYVFLAGWDVPTNRRGEYILQFATTDGTFYLYGSLQALHG